MATAVDLAVNPAAPDDMLVLWSNGKLKGLGSVVPPTDYEDQRLALYEAHHHPALFDTHFTRLQVTSWAPLGGYVLREWGVGQGIVVAFGNAQAPGTLGTTTDPHPYNTLNYYGYNIMRAFAMDPAANGNGYIMSRFGRIYRIGIPTALTTNNFTAPQGEMIDMAMEYSTRKTVLLDQQGRLFMGNGSVYAGTSEKDSDTYLNALYPKWQLTTWHVFRRLLVVDWTTVATKPKGYVLDDRGYIHRFNTPELPLIKFRWGTSTARALAKISYPTPFTYKVMAYNGSVMEVLSSTPPTVNITNPGTVTTTTRPAIEWDVLDKEFDQEDFTEIHFFHAAGFTPGVTTPNEIQTLRGSIQHSTRPKLPLPNTTVGVAIRVTETAAPGKQGLVSAWDSESWLQNVTRPGAPTIALTPLNSPPRVQILVTAATGATENGRIADVEYTDVASPAETDWKRVRATDNVTAPVYVGAGTYTYTDREIPAGVARKYRARTVVNDPDNYNSSLYSATSALTTSSIPPLSWWLLIPEALSADWATTQVALKAAPDAQLEHTQRIATALPLDGTQRGAIATRTRPRAKTQSIAVWALTEAEYLTIMQIVQDGRTMYISDVLGRGMHVNLSASPTETQLRSTALAGTPYPVRHAHTIGLPIAEVRRPPVPDRLELA